jgi:AcrR family transcriptional regulator
MRSRAKPVFDRRERERSILDATEALLRQSSERALSMAAVAAHAGVAKGTVYLYVASKEELLLKLHERHVHEVFDALDVSLSQPGATTESVFAVFQTHVIDHPTYLMLVNHCLDTMGGAMPVEVAYTFKCSVAERATATGAQIDRAFVLNPGEGVRLLMHTHALVLGLWQLLKPLPELDALYEARQFTFFQRNYAAEFHAAFVALWSGRICAAHREGLE